MHYPTNVVANKQHDWNAIMYESLKSNIPNKDDGPTRCNEFRAVFTLFNHFIAFAVEME